MPVEKNIKLLYWFNFFSDLRLYAPIAIIYFAHVSGSFVLGMSIFAIARVSSAIFEVPTGIFSDRIGRRKTLIFGAFASVLCVIFYALGSYWFLAIGAVFEGLSRAFYSGNNDALLHNTLTQTGKVEQYHTFLGKTSSMFQVALAISAVFGSVIASISFAIVMWISVLPQIICVLIGFRIIEPSIKREESGNIYAHLKESFQYFIRNRKIRLLSLATGIGFGVGETSHQFQAAFFNTLWPLWAIGFARLLSYLGAMASFWHSGRIIKKFHPIKILMFGNLGTRFMNFVALLYPTMLSPVLMSSTSLYYGVSRVARTTVLQKEFSEKQRATMGSLSSLLESIVLGIASIGIGMAADSLGVIKALLIIQAIMLSVNIFYLRLLKLEKF